MKERAINIRVILDDLTDHPLLKDLSLERVINYTINFFRIVGCPKMFEEKTSIIHIDNYRALLPCDFYNIIQVRDSNDNIYRVSTDSFHMSPNKSDNDFTYKIQGGVIFTSLKEGDIEIAYNAIMIDEEGYPLLPDNSELIRALEAYIKVQRFEVLFDLGKIHPQVFQNAQQQYAWAVGACQSEFNRMSLDEMESFTNSWNTLIVRANEHNKGFKTTGSKEYIKIH